MTHYLSRMVSRVHEPLKQEGGHALVVCAHQLVVVLHAGGVNWEQTGIILNIQLYLFKFNSHCIDVYRTIIMIMQLISIPLKLTELYSKLPYRIIFRFLY